MKVAEPNALGIVMLFSRFWLMVPVLALLAKPGGGYQVAVVDDAGKVSIRTIKVGDRVLIRGLLHSDCFGLTGRVLEVRQSALFGRGVQRCKVDFNGRIRRLLSVHLAPIASAAKNAVTAA